MATFLGPGWPDHEAHREARQRRKTTFVRTATPQWSLVVQSPLVIFSAGYVCPDPGCGLGMSEPPNMCSSNSSVFKIISKMLRVDLFDFPFPFGPDLLVCFCFAFRTDLERR